MPLILTQHGIRKLTPRECFSLQGFEEDFIIPEGIKHTTLYKMAGNSVVLPLIERIAENIYRVF